MAGTVKAKETAKLGVGHEGVQAPTLLAESVHDRSSRERAAEQRRWAKEEKVFSDTASAGER